MGMSTTFRDRSNKNERVYLNAACILAQKETATPLLPLSEEWEARRLRLMAFLNSAQATQPDIKATFYFPPSFEIREVKAAQSWQPNTTNWHRRVGRPRGSWVREIIQGVWNRMRLTEPDLPAMDLNLPEHRREVAWHLVSSSKTFAL